MRIPSNAGGCHLRFHGSFPHLCGFHRAMDPLTCLRGPNRKVWKLIRLYLSQTKKIKMAIHRLMSSTPTGSTKLQFLERYSPVTLWSIHLNSIFQDHCSELHPNRDTPPSTRLQLASHQAVEEHRRAMPNIMEESKEGSKTFSK